MSLPSYTDLNAALVPLVLKAGALIMDIYHDGFSVERKADESPVTIADQKAEDLILDGLARHFPNISVVAEEMCAGGARPDISGLFFLVDPLDGTKEFIAQRNEFTVNVGLIQQGVPVYGVVYAPAIGALYATLAADAAGVALIGSKDCGTADALEKIPAFKTIKARPFPESDAIAVGSRSHQDAESAAFLALNGIDTIRASGSSLKFCELARGAADVYPRFGPTMEWDTAAGDAVLRAAGGAVVSGDGVAFCYGKAGFQNGAFVACGSGGLERLRF